MASTGRCGSCSGRRPSRYGLSCGCHLHVVCLGQCRMAEPISLHARPQPMSSFRWPALVSTRSRWVPEETSSTLAGNLHCGGSSHSDAVLTSPLSRGLARLLRRGPGMWRLEPARERFRGWMRTSDARPPFQVECSSQTPKVLPLSRAPYTTLPY